MKALDSILGKFTAVKRELVEFISGAELDIKDMEGKNDDLRSQISDNVDTMNVKGREIKLARLSIKQIDKLTGGK